MATLLVGEVPTLDGGPRGRRHRHRPTPHRQRPDQPAATGNIDKVHALTGTIPANGFFVLGSTALGPDQDFGALNSIENGGKTILLVRSFSAAVDQDVDTNDDGVADISIGTIVDPLRTPTSR